jgi:hypothetical protein
MLLFQDMRVVSKILLALTAVVVTSLFFVQPVQAFTITLEQVGNNVVANGSGAFNLVGLTLSGPGAGGLPLVQANSGIIQIGAANHPISDAYIGFTGPTNFGVGTQFLANIGSGDFVALIQGIAFGGGVGDVLFVPTGYVSGTPLLDSMTFDHKTIHSLGLTPGTYTWSWGTGTGIGNQFFTVQIVGPTTVPDGGSTVSLLSCALLGLAAFRRKLSR